MSEKDNKSTLRRGVCKNPECDLCMSHEIQEVEPGADFVCSDCGKPLYDLPKKTGGHSPLKKILIIVGIVVILAAAVFAVIKFISDKDKDYTEPESTENVSDDESDEPDGRPEEPRGGIDSAIVDTVKPAGEIDKPKTPQTGTKLPPVNPGNGSVRLSYGTYTGPISAGKPDGMGGQFVFTRACTIDLKDGYGNTVTVSPRDKIVSTKFENGYLTQGEIHFTDGTRKMLVGIRQKL